MRKTFGFEIDNLTLNQVETICELTGGWLDLETNQIVVLEYSDTPIKSVTYIGKPNGRQ